ncbi:MAG: alanine--tRNA ligase [Bacteroidetes bacterium]|nr:alanine--tRNA ligase [Bacteroidota bacterium]
MTSAEIRKKFLDFFVSKGHHIVPSAPIVLKDDPTLLFTNAGMNQFKDYFLGNRVAPYKRVVDTQKCLRVSGKHNDLEEVGVDTYHHTMFEMLGNWSFGDYFKKEAIEWSWELLTEIFQMDKSRLYATVFEGDAKENIPPSTIALGVWKKLLPEEHIVFGNKKDNFWEMGDTGPCGPCSEIHVDCRSDEERAKLPGHLLVNKDHPQVIEIWNNVFIQYNRMKDGSLQPLDATHVDTGMGLERLVRVLQGKHSNYETDLFSGTIEQTEKISGKKYTASDSKQDVAFRVLADHIRAIAFTIADGQLPSNTGAGYVVRRILRRAVRYYYSYLDVKEPILFKLLPGLSTQFKDVFPELEAQLSFVSKVVKEEEETFLRTLGKGLKKIDDIIEASSKENLIKGTAAFELYDTYGFPFDLTRLIAQEKGMLVDETGFEQEMQLQKNRSKSAAAVDTGDWIEVSKPLHGKTSFVGYETLSCETSLLKYRKVEAKGQSSFQAVLENTPFYAESGGQVGDTGMIRFGSAEIKVLNTKKENDLIIHTIDTLPAEIQPSVTASVDMDRRKEITKHHTLTHLLHAALRATLGSHVAQKGSLVNEQGMRFDFSHFAKMTEQEMEQVTSIVNQKIRANIPVVIREMPKEEAMKLGAMALFGEKYGDAVRVVTIDPNFSIELCGGTHVGSTGELGYCMITSESSVAAGVRRIEAVCSNAAEQYIKEQQQLLKHISASLKHPKDLIRTLEMQSDELSSLKRQLEAADAKLLGYVSNELMHQFESIKEIQFLGTLVDVSSVDALKKLCNELRCYNDHAFVTIGAVIDGKPAVAVGIADALQQSSRLDANALIKNEVAKWIKGGGGGQKTLAVAGGQDAATLMSAIDAVKKALHA